MNDESYEMKELFMLQLNHMILCNLTQNLFKKIIGLIAFANGQIYFQANIVKMHEVG